MAETIQSRLTAFQDFLKRYDRPGAVSYALSLLGSGALTVPELYEKVLAPSLNGILVGREEEHDMIWREHVMTGIVRSVIESALPHVLYEREKYLLPGFHEKAMLACPQEEYHDLGVRMGADFFTIAGYEVTFIGSNTPASNILSAAKALKPDVIDIAVSNYLNLVALQKLVPSLRQQAGPGVKIILSGSALAHTGRTHRDFEADGIVNTFADILALRGNTHENSH